MNSHSLDKLVLQTRIFQSQLIRNNIKINKIYNYLMQPSFNPSPPQNTNLPRSPSPSNLPTTLPTNPSNLPTQKYVQTYQYNAPQVPTQTPQYLSPGSAVNQLPNVNNRPYVISQPIPPNTKNIHLQGVIPQGTIHQATTIAPSAPKPQSKSRIQYVPYQKKVVDYQTRQVVNTMWVPVQRKCLNYYAIEHITEYLPRQVDDVRYEMVPQQHVQYRLQYIPVEKEIVHLPGDAINAPQGYQNYQYNTQVHHQNQLNIPGIRPYPLAPTPNYGTINSTIGAINQTNIPGYTQLQGRGPVPKSNFVTSDGYVPSYLSSNPILNEALYMPTNKSGVGLAGNESNTSRRQSYLVEQQKRQTLNRNNYSRQSYMNMNEQRNSKYDLLGY